MPHSPARRASPPPAILPGSDELYRLLVEHVTDYAIFITTADGHVATWSEGAGRMTGYTEDEAVGSHVSILYPPEDAASGAPARDLEIAAERGRCDAIAWRVCKDGSRIWVTAVITALMDADGRVIGYGQILRDLTDRRLVAQQYEESRQRYRSLFEHNPDAIFSLDLEGRVASANPATAHLSGHEPDELTGTPLWPLVLPADRDRARELFALAAAGEPQHAEVAIAHRSGRRVDLSATLVPILVEGEILGVYCIAEDVTERKRAEAEREIFVLRERIARAEAEAANQAKSDFLAVVSHELRSPLNVITGFADLLSDGDAGSLSDVQLRHMGRIQASSRQLLGMIDEVLSYARMESGREGVVRGPVDLAALAREAAAAHRPAARAKGLDVEVEAHGDCTAHTDRAKVAQILANLLSNAVKFTAQGGIRVGVRCGAGASTLTVADTGPGIGADQVEKIWEPFWQAEQPTVRRAGGTGLGLSVARRRAGLLGGDVEVDSRPGYGSTFTVRLPALPPSDAH
jgi:PAS domain S-box-containing protein